jgi:hypothetical protein
MEGGLIKNSVITNYDLIELSGPIQCPNCGMGSFINALPDSIMRNFRGLADEFSDYYWDRGLNINFPYKICAYYFSHQSKTDYVLSDGFIKWLQQEHRKIRGGSD